jgi:thiosulfate/3-mercaptopyruvate sulfurtransferase
VVKFDLSDPDRPKRSLTMPTADWFAARAGALGIADDSQVVVYDRRENMWAARLWWMLRTFGFGNAAVLDGGWTAWQQQGHPVCTTPCGYPPATLHAAARTEMVVDKRAVLAALEDPGVVLINALDDANTAVK